MVKAQALIFHSSKFGLEFCLATNELGVFLRGSFGLRIFILKQVELIEVL